jgi:predicted DNA-binding protein
LLIPVTAEVFEAIHAYAEEDDRPAASYVRLILKQHIDEMDRKTQKKIVEHKIKNMPALT